MPRVAFRAVRSRRRYFQAEFADEVRDLMGQRMDAEVKPHFIEQFDDIVADWDHKVTFEGRKYIGPDDIRVAVYPTGPHKQIWKWVTGGTKPHIIRAKNAPVLAFQLGYVPRTSPGGGYGGAGRATGDMAYAKEVRHPGTAPREFEKHVALKNKGWYSQKMEAIWKWVIGRV